MRIVDRLYYEGRKVRCLAQFQDRQAITRVRADSRDLWAVVVSARGSRESARIQPTRPHSSVCIDLVMVCPFWLRSTAALDGSTRQDSCRSPSGSEIQTATPGSAERVSLQPKILTALASDLIAMTPNGLNMRAPGPIRPKRSFFRRPRTGIDRGRRDRPRAAQSFKPGRVAGAGATNGSEAPRDARRRRTGSSFASLRPDPATSP